MDRFYGWNGTDGRCATDDCGVVFFRFLLLGGLFVSALHSVASISLFLLFSSISLSFGTVEENVLNGHSITGTVNSGFK